jgi:hypothetical protein
VNIFLGGAHRTGKTSVAQKLADKLGYNYVPTRIGSMKLWDIMGSPSAHYSYGERVKIQEELYRYFIDVIDSVQLTDNVFDRSLFDLVGYLHTNYDSTCSSVFDDYICNEFLPNIAKFYKNTYNTLVFILQPNIVYKYCLVEVGKNNKVYNSFAYRQGLTDVIVGFAVRNLAPYQYKIVPEHLDIDGTVDFIMNTI